MTTIKGVEIDNERVTVDVRYVRGRAKKDALEMMKLESWMEGQHDEKKRKREKTISIRRRRLWDFDHFTDSRKHEQGPPAQLSLPRSRYRQAPNGLHFCPDAVIDNTHPWY